MAGTRLRTQAARALWDWVESSPKHYLPILLALVLVVLVVSWYRHRDRTDVAASEHGPGTCLLCFWNVENLFDDRNDDRSPDDEPYDNWFARDPEALRLKLRHLSEALVALNGGRGPDILATVEVESLRAAGLLRDALNERLADPRLHYKTILMNEVNAGRHIAPAVITRLPADAAAARLLGTKLRVLETRISVNGYDLTLVASHWTSRLTDKTGSRRERYADAIYRAYRDRAARDPDVDFLVCGDFNDSPDESSVVRHLHTTGDRSAVSYDVTAGLLLNLMADKDPREFGTHVRAGQRYIYDQVIVSRGMLDPAGWSCDPDSVRTVDTLTRPGDRSRRPWRFGHEKDSTYARGYSDHFPVTVRLTVQAK
jgi:endonuclease/exonuclease/phosphatase family metal-dependent hydrolase